MHIGPIETYAVIGLDLPINGVDRHHLQRIGMQKQGVTLRIFKEAGTVGCKSISGLFIIITIFALQRHMLGRINQAHIPIDLSHTRIPIIEDRVTDQDLLTRFNLGLIKQKGCVVHRIIPSS